MVKLKKSISEYALRLGLCDVAFVSPDDFSNDGTDRTFSPRSLLNNAASIILLFAAYRPVYDARSGEAAVSSYYVASNAAYHASKLLVTFLQDYGVNALHTKNLPARACALRAGGFIGDNGFYYHERFGSTVNIQTIVTDTIPPDAQPLNNINGCRHCGACAAACPSKAVDNIERCLRKHINGFVPEYLRGDVYQLFGCEKCQNACPINSDEKHAARVYPVKELLEGRHLPELKQLVGTNHARKNRVLAQAALVAANRRQYDTMDALVYLSKTAPEPVREHALWAYQRLSEQKRLERDDK